MITVQVKNGNVDGALKKFKQRVAKSGLPSEVKKKQAFDKPGVQRRNAKKLSKIAVRQQDVKDAILNFSLLGI